MAPEEFCFTMTGDTGDRTHGFCRRIFWSPSPKHFKVPVVLCLISNELWGIFYYKVLEVVEEFLKQEGFLSSKLSTTLPQTSAAAKFLEAVNERLRGESTPGTVLRIPFPDLPSVIRITAPQSICTLTSNSGKLKSTGEFIELQVPPLSGGYPSMAGVSLARLLWRIPVHCLMTLFGSLLLERRIIMVCKSKDTLSAAIHAASALIYPFGWHHRFYLPIIPESMLDFLQAPFPYLVGLPAELMDFKGLEMNEVTLIDLDLGVCTPESGSTFDDALVLPRRAKLEEGLNSAVRSLRSPTEFEGNARIFNLVSDYFLCLFKHYRRYIKPLESDGSRRQRGLVPRSSTTAASPRGNDEDDEAIDGHGLKFGHAVFVASHRSKTSKQFLNLFRQSQMYEVFIRERLALASTGQYPKDDPFEHRISLIGLHERRRLQPGIQPHLTWSRRLSGLPASKKVLSVNVREIHKAHSAKRDSDLGNTVEEQTDDTDVLATTSKRRLLSKRRLDPRFSQGQSIKKIVTAIAQDSAKRILKEEPGSFLNRSRASLASVSESVLAPPEAEEVTDKPETIDQPLISFTIDEEIDSSAGSFSNEDRLTADSVRSRDFFQPSPRTVDLNHTSPWNDSPEQALFNAWNTPSVTSPAVSSSSQGSAQRDEARLLLRDLTLDARPPPDAEEKKRQTDAFVESNLRSLSNPACIRLGLPPKPQRNGNKN